jgi:hypothetical protein
MRFRKMLTLFILAIGLVFGRKTMLGVEFCEGTGRSVSVIRADISNCEFSGSVLSC